MTCHDFQNQRAAYLAGTLPADAAFALEAHAANCNECGAALERDTRLTSADFAPPPPLPPELRTRTMAAVQARRQQRVRPRWWGGAMMLATAAALTLLVVRSREKSAQRVVADTTVAMTAALDTTTVDGLVDARARPEFTALDAAAAELQDALDSSPDDAELRRFLASVRARRDELARRVKDARS